MDYWPESFIIGYKLRIPGVVETVCVIKAYPSDLAHVGGLLRIHTLAVQRSLVTFFMYESRLLYQVYNMLYV